MRNNHTRMRLNPARRLPAIYVKGLHSSMGAILRLPRVVSLSSTACHSGSLGSSLMIGIATMTMFFLRTMPFHNPSIGINLLNRYGGLGRKLCGHICLANVLSHSTGEMSIGWLRLALDPPRETAYLSTFVLNKEDLVANIMCSLLLPQLAAPGECHGALEFPPADHQAVPEVKENRSSIQSVPFPPGAKTNPAGK